MHSGSIKCAEALIKEAPLSVDLNLPCTDMGLYPLHCATLSFFPSITELFLYNGASTDVRPRPFNPPDDIPRSLDLEEHDVKLPFHMALDMISFSLYVGMHFQAIYNKIDCSIMSTRNAKCIGESWVACQQ